jgi:hypothetical protein
VNRYLAGAAVALLLSTGVFFLWQSHAESAPSLPSAPQARPASAMLLPAGPLRAPEATPRSREEKRFGRYDHDKDGKVEAAEYFAGRKKNFDKLDVDHNGALSFQEYAVKGIEKFNGADRDRTGWLTPAEFAMTAPPPPKHRSCSCNISARSTDNSDD